MTGGITGWGRSRVAYRVFCNLHRHSRDEERGRVGTLVIFGPHIGDWRHVWASWSAPAERGLPGLRSVCVLRRREG